MYPLNSTFPGSNAMHMFGALNSTQPNVQPMPSTDYSLQSKTSTLFSHQMASHQGLPSVFALGGTLGSSCDGLRTNYPNNPSWTPISSVSRSFPLQSSFAYHTVSGFSTSSPMRPKAEGAFAVPQGISLQQPVAPSPIKHSKMPPPLSSPYCHRPPQGTRPTGSPGIQHIKPAVSPVFRTFWQAPAAPDTRKTLPPPCSTWPPPRSSSISPLKNSPSGLLLNYQKQHSASSLFFNSTLNSDTMSCNQPLNLSQASFRRSSENESDTEFDEDLEPLDLSMKSKATLEEMHTQCKIREEQEVVTEPGGSPSTAQPIEDPAAWNLTCSSSDCCPSEETEPDSDNTTGELSSDGEPPQREKLLKRKMAFTNPSNQCSKIRQPLKKDRPSTHHQTISKPENLIAKNLPTEAKTDKAESRAVNPERAKSLQEDLDEESPRKKKDRDQKDLNFQDHTEEKDNDSCEPAMPGPPIRIKFGTKTSKRRQSDYIKHKDMTRGHGQTDGRAVKPISCAADVHIISPKNAQNLIFKVTRICHTCECDFRATPFMICPLCSPHHVIHNQTDPNSTPGAPPNGIIWLDTGTEHEPRLFAASKLEPKTVFGPLKGVKITKDKITKETDIGNVWPLKPKEKDGQEFFLDTSDKEKSNWMCYIRISKQQREHNMAILLQNGQILFVTTQKVYADQELLLKPHNPITIHLNRGYDVSCVKCDLTLMNPLQIAHHRMVFHPLPLLTCTVCSEKVTGEDGMRRHSLVCSSQVIVPLHSVPKRTPTSRWQCKVCQSSFKSKSGLRSHKSLVHNQGTLAKKLLVYACEKCEGAFKTKWGLERHLRTHTLEESGHSPMDCSLCGKRFWRRSSFRRHMLAHEGAGEFQKSPCCSCCGRSFYSSSNLKVHMLTHSGIRPFMCNQEGCTSGFTTKQSLQFHYIKRHDFSYENMPNISRSVPFTFEEYAGITKGENTTTVKVETSDTERDGPIEDADPREQGGLLGNIPDIATRPP